jgi:hypothetical protein
MLPRCHINAISAARYARTTRSSLIRQPLFACKHLRISHRDDPKRI